MIKRDAADCDGNLRRMTVFGESAGGRSAFSNVARPTASELLAAAIVESGAHQTTLPAPSASLAQPALGRFVPPAAYPWYGFARDHDCVLRAALRGGHYSGGAVSCAHRVTRRITSMPVRVMRHTSLYRRASNGPSFGR